MSYKREIDDLIEAALRKQGMLFPETIEEVEEAERAYQGSIDSGSYIPENQPLPPDFFTNGPRIRRGVKNSFEDSTYSVEMGLAARSGGEISSTDWAKMDKDREEKENRNGKHP